MIKNISWKFLPFVSFIIIFLALINRHTFTTILSTLFQPHSKYSEYKNQTLTDYLKEKSGVTIETFYVIDSYQFFAGMTGIPNKPVMTISKGLLQSFPEDQLEYVLLHEVGHYVHAHSVKEVLLEIIVILFICYWLYILKTSLATKTVLAITMAVILAIGVIQIMRNFEREADLYALNHLDNPQSMIEATRTLRKAALNSSDETLIKTLFYRNVPYSERIKMAQEYKKTIKPKKIEKEPPTNTLNEIYWYKEEVPVIFYDLSGILYRQVLNSRNTIPIFSDEYLNNFFLLPETKEIIIVTAENMYKNDEFGERKETIFTTEGERATIDTVRISEDKKKLVFFTSLNDSKFSSALHTLHLETNHLNDYDIPVPQKIEQGYSKSNSLYWLDDNQTFIWTDVVHIPTYERSKFNPPKEIITFMYLGNSNNNQSKLFKTINEFPSEETDYRSTVQLSEIDFPEKLVQPEPDLPGAKIINPQYDSKKENKLEIKQNQLVVNDEVILEIKINLEDKNIISNAQWLPGDNHIIFEIYDEARVIDVNTKQTAVVYTKSNSRTMWFLKWFNQPNTFEKPEDW